MTKKKSKNQEYNNFASIAKEWWEPDGKFKILHKIRSDRPRHKISRTSPYN